MEKKYTILMDTKHNGSVNSRFYITEEGANIIWNAYKTMFRSESQTMDRREQRGGIAWLSEVNMWKEKGYLPTNFDLENYKFIE